MTMAHDTQSPGLTGAEILATSSAAESYTGTEETGQNGNLEKIRDILFGAQLRDHERRFKLLEHNLVKEAAALRSELTKRFDALEAFMQQEVAVLSGRLQHEQQVRGEALQTLVRDLTALSAALDRKSQDLGLQTSQAEKLLRSEAMAQADNFKDALQATHAELTAKLKQSVEELRASKTDRAALAHLFTELSQQLNSEDAKP